MRALNEGDTKNSAKRIQPIFERRLPCRAGSVFGMRVLNEGGTKNSQFPILAISGKRYQRHSYYRTLYYNVYYVAIADDLE